MNQGIYKEKGGEDKKIEELKRLIRKFPLLIANRDNSASL